MLNRQKEIQIMSLEQAEAEVAELRDALAQAELRLDAIRGCTRREQAKQRSCELVGELVKRREKLEWSVGYLAKVLGCGRDNVAQRESGQRPAPAGSQTSRCKLIRCASAPCYQRQLDLIEMPAASKFHTPERREAILLHELVYWTGHVTRQHRVFGANFGDEAYAMEELVAEQGGASLCRQAGLPGLMMQSAYLDF